LKTFTNTKPKPRVISHEIFQDRVWAALGEYKTRVLAAKMGFGLPHPVAAHRQIVPVAHVIVHHGDEVQLPPPSEEVNPL
jgi:hypothetical protein